MVEKSVIKRLYLTTQQMGQFPETQYLLLSLSKRSNISEGHYISNENSDLNDLRCLAIGVEEELPKECYKDEKTIPDYTEFPLFSKGSSSVLVRVLVKVNIIQIYCMSKSDVVYGKGLLILHMDRSCMLKRNGRTLRSGGKIELPEKGFGFNVLYNAALKHKEVSIESNGDLDTEEISKALDELKRNLQKMEDCQYDSAFFVDIALSVIVGVIVLWIFLLKVMKKYCERSSTQ